MEILGSDIWDKFEDLLPTFDDLLPPVDFLFQDLEFPLNEGFEELETFLELEESEDLVTECQDIEKNNPEYKDKYIPLQDHSYSSQIPENVQNVPDVPSQPKKNIKDTETSINKTKIYRISANQLKNSKVFYRY